MNVQKVADQILSNKLAIMTSITIPILLGGLLMVPASVAKATMGYSTYCSIDQEVKIDRPITWDVNENYTTPKEFYFTNGDAITFRVLVIPYPEFGGHAIPASQLADQWLRYFKNNVPGFSLIDGGNYVIQSRSMSWVNPTFYLKFSYNEPEFGPGPANAFQVYVYAGQRNYIFTLITTPQLFEKTLPIAEQMLRSASVTSSSILSACD